MANTWLCSHPQACNLVRDYIHSTQAPLPTLKKAISVVKDPHHIEPNAKEIKAMYQADNFITAPMSLNPWAKSVLKMRREKKSKVIELKVSADTSAAKAHFWLYPDVACQLWQQVHAQLKLAPSEPNCPYQLKYSQALKETRPIIISHDALIPFFQALGFTAYAMKGSGHHEEPKPKQVKLISDTVSSSKQVIWIEENNIHFPHSIEKLQRPNDIVIEIDSNGDFPGDMMAPLKGLIQKLEGLSNVES